MLRVGYGCDERGRRGLVGLDGRDCIVAAINLFFCLFFSLMYVVTDSDSESSQEEWL